jgi:ribonuclease E
MDVFLFDFHRERIFRIFDLSCRDGFKRTINKIIGISQKSKAWDLMDSRNGRSVYCSCGHGKRMAEKKVSTTTDEQITQPKRKKASIGAWWKSTTEDAASKESSSKPAAERSGKSPGKRPAKTAAATEPVETRNGAGGVSPAEATLQDSGKPTVPQVVRQEQAQEKPNDPMLSEESGGARKPARKRPPRKRKTAARQAESKGSAVEAQGEEVLPSAFSDQSAAAVEPEKDTAEQATPAKPRRKRGRPRKKPAEKVGEAAEAEGLSEDSERAIPLSALHVTEISEQSAETAEEGKRAGKPGRKRSPRKKRTSPVSGSLNIDQDLAINGGPSVAESVEGKTASRVEETSVGLQESDAAAASGVEAKGIPAEKTAPEARQRTREDQDSPADASSRSRRPQREKQPAKEEEAPKGNKPVIKLLINAEEPEECRLALLEDGRLESIHVATSTRTQTKNNIYKAKIVAIEPNLQAAFVDYGTEKNGFLPFSEIHPEYYKENVSEKAQKYIDQQQWKKLSIIDVVERGREILVQVVKEEVGTKGANMTTYLSLPGRCVVLMPGSDSTGISRKISGEERRSLLREHLLSMGIPEGIGWIVRTASIDITKTALQRDVNYLLNLWEEVKKKGQEMDGVGLLYQDHDHVLRFLREHFDPDIQEILVDDKDALEQVKGFIELLPSKQRNVRCKLHGGARPIFNQYSIEDQIESIYQPRVNLPSGGSIVIDPTEALVAIDVNSGSTGKGKNFEDTIFQANMEAAKELARQLRLRDLGGLIVVDFIDMRSNKNIRDVEKEVKTAMKRDKAKVDISRISKFGLMQISRQKLGAPIEAGNYRVCGHCKGRGIVRSVETLALFYLRRIQTAASRKMVKQIECHFPLDVAQYLLNNKRQELRDLEKKYSTEVVIIADPSLKPADNEIIFHKLEKDESGKKQS